MNTSAQIAFAHVARKTSHFLPGQFWTGGGEGRGGECALLSEFHGRPTRSAAILVYCSVRAETGHNCATSSRYRVLESGLKNIRVRCCILRIRVDVIRIRKEKGCGLKNIWISVAQPRSVVV